MTIYWKSCAWLSELPQRPVLLLSGDFSQLGPMAGQRAIIDWLCDDTYFAHETLTGCFRTSDPTLRDFLKAIRSEQPSRECLEDFFAGRRLSLDLEVAVEQSMNIAADRGKHFVWLTVTNKGADAINRAAGPSRVRCVFPAGKGDSQFTVEQQ